MNGSKRNYMIYGTMLAVFGLLMWWVVRMGKAYDTSDVVAVRHADSSVDLLRETLASNLTHPVPLLLLQIIAILVAVRIFSYLFKYLRSARRDRRDRGRNRAGAFRAGPFLSRQRSSSCSSRRRSCR